MRIGHVLIVGIAGLALRADAQPPKQPQPAPKPAPKTPAPKPPAPKPPAPEPVPETLLERHAIPPYQPSPPRFAVAPFLNQSTTKSLEWLIAGAPFEIDEKTENVLGLEPTGGPRVVGTPFDSEDPSLIAAYAKQRDATYVIAGWVSQRSAQLRLAITLWKVTNGTPVAVAEVKRTGDIGTYHHMLGDALAEAWGKAGVAIDAQHAERLARPLSANLYPVELMGRGLGYLTGAIDGKVDLKAAEHDLERAVFIDPKMFEGQRLAGELYLAQGDDKKATAKFNYATDLAPDDLASLRAAATAARAAGKHELARQMFERIVAKKPWDLDARYELGAAMWALGDAENAEKQLVQVTAQRPDHLAARHVLVLIHASRNDTAKLVAELQAIAVRAPGDLEVKADLASAYGAIGNWKDATDQLELIAAARTPDLALLVRIGDGHRKAGDLDAALAWYGKAQRLAPLSSLPGYTSAQALYDAGRLAEANRFYTNLQKYSYDLGAAEEALGAIALRQNRPDDAAWYLRRAAHDAPRNLIARRALIAAELARRDHATALTQLEPALAAWPSDGPLHYLAGVAHAMADEKEEARAELVTAIADAPDEQPPRAALSALDAGGQVVLSFKPDLVRPWGDAEALQAALDRYAVTSTQMATTRVQYQTEVLGMLGALGEGPLARAKAGAGRTCPVGDVAPVWAAAQKELARYQRLGVDLEADYRFVMRHDEVGATAGLLPNARQQSRGGEEVVQAGACGRRRAARRVAPRARPRAARGRLQRSAARGRGGRSGALQGHPGGHAGSGARARAAATQAARDVLRRQHALRGSGGRLDRRLADRPGRARPPECARGGRWGPDAVLADARRRAVWRSRHAAPGVPARWLERDDALPEVRERRDDRTTERRND